MHITSIPISSRSGWWWWGRWRPNHLYRLSCLLTKVGRSTDDSKKFENSINLQKKKVRLRRWENSRLKVKTFLGIRNQYQLKLISEFKDFFILELDSWVYQIRPKSKCKKSQNSWNSTQNPSHPQKKKTLERFDTSNARTTDKQNLRKLFLMLFSELSYTSNPCVYVGHGIWLRFGDRRRPITVDRKVETQWWCQGWVNIKPNTTPPLLLKIVVALTLPHLESCWPCRLFGSEARVTWALKARYRPRER